MEMEKKPKHTIEYMGIIIEGSTREVAIKLRQHPFSLSMTKIAELLGQSRQSISSVLKKSGFEGRLKQKKISKILLKNYRNDVIQEITGLSLNYIKLQRKKARVPQPLGEKEIKTRQDLFIKVVFGDGYTAGDNFGELLSLLSKKVKLSPKGDKALQSFYIDGKLVKCKNYQKVFRHIQRRKIKKYVEQHIQSNDIEKLLIAHMLKEKK